MSRPCFALSVVLCCMAGPLLIIGNAHAQDTVVSPRHDPGECIVCPLAHGSLEVCGGYSDYDYNQYWHETPPLATSEASPQVELELEVAQSLTDDSTDEAWETGYEDYYADYVFGDDSATAAKEDLTLEETSNPTASVGDTTEVAAVAEGTSGEPTSELGDEYGWYSDDSAVPDDYLVSDGRDAPIDSTEAEGADLAEAATADATSAAESYEEEWFSYESEAAAQAPATTNLQADEAYEALSDSASAGTIDTAEPSATGYDEAYDDAMTAESKVAEPVANTAPAVDDYESFYDAYGGLDNFEPAALESSEFEASEAVAETTPVSDPAWLTDLVARMLAPAWAAAGNIASETSIPEPQSHAAIYEDKCSQAWDCEAEYWAQPQAEQPSLVLGAADALDGMASLLRDAAEGLRGLASRSVAETAQATADNSPR